MKALLEKLAIWILGNVSGIRDLALGNRPMGLMVLPYILELSKSRRDLSE
jgi:hypothetical protein